MWARRPAGAVSEWAAGGVPKAGGVAKAGLRADGESNGAPRSRALWEPRCKAWVAVDTTSGHAHDLGTELPGKTAQASKKR